MATSRAYLVAKRAFDLVVSGSGLVALSPLLLGVGVAVRLSSNGPILFRQDRVGLRGRRFAILKFRTMRTDSKGPEITTRSDSRITRVGKLLRRYKLDELPQLWNVLRGEMSLVGPRPEVPRYVARFSRDYEFILSVRPGITDFAAIEYRNEEEILGQSDDPVKTYVDVVLPEKIRLYRRYIEEQSLETDFKLIFRTLAAVAWHA